MRHTHVDAKLGERANCEDVGTRLDGLRDYDLAGRREERGCHEQAAHKLGRDIPGDGEAARQERARDLEGKLPARGERDAMADELLVEGREGALGQAAVTIEAAPASKRCDDWQHEAKRRARLAAV